MHQVLKIDHILERAFNYCDKIQRSRCAFVCKQWLDPALNAYWHDVFTLRYIFKLLGKIRMREIDPDDYDVSIKYIPWYYEFAQMPKEKDWKIFEKVSRRVRHITISDEFDFVSHADPVLLDVAITRPSLVLLPNLVSLTVDCETFHMKAATLLLHPGLLHLKIFFDGEEDRLKKDSISDFFSFVVSKAPHITELAIGMHGEDFGYSEIERLVLRLIIGLKSLRMVALPIYSLTSRTFQTLALLPNLKIITADRSGEYQSEEKDEVSKFQPILNSGAFSSLRDLSLQVSLGDATLLLGLDHFPAKLQCFTIQTLSVESGPACQTFLATLVDKCQSLVELKLDMREQYDNVDFDRLSFTNIEPILQSHVLKSLSLMHVRPLMINNNDVAKLAGSLSHLETLILNPEPFIAEESCLTHEVLVSLAEHCPNLRILGLYVNASQTVNIPVDFVPAKYLKTLCFGASPIQDKMVFKSQLAQLCPPSCTIADSIAPWWKLLIQLLSSEVKENIPKCTELASIMESP